MTISEEQRLARMTRVGASDIGKILGLSKWGTASDVWLSKTRMQGPSKMSKAADRGVRLEHAVIKFATDQPGVVPDGCLSTENILYERTTAGGTPVAVNTDAVVWSGNPEAILTRDDEGNPRTIDEVPVALIEAKTAASAEGWGRPGTDEIPLTYQVQVQAQMWASGATVCFVPVLLGEGLAFHLYKVQWHPELWSEIEAGLDKFWQHVIEDRMPEGPPPTLPSLIEVVRDEEEVTELPGEGYDKVVEWLTAVEARKEALEVESLAKRKVIAMLDKAEVGLLPQGTVTFLANARGARTLRWKAEEVPSDARPDS